MGQVAPVVGLVTWTVLLAAGARSPKLQVRVSLGGLPPIEQFGLSGLSVQSMPLPPGSASESVTPVAVPVPTLLTVMLKPMGLPALTEGASAVLTIRRSGQLIRIVAWACTCGWLVACAVAVFG